MFLYISVLIISLKSVLLQAVKHMEKLENKIFAVNSFNIISERTRTCNKSKYIKNSVLTLPRINMSYVRLLLILEILLSYLKNK